MIIKPRLDLGKLNRIDSLLEKKDFLDEIGAIAVLDILDNIDSEGRNINKPWKQSKRAERESGITLKDSDLMYLSIKFDVRGSAVLVYGNRLVNGEDLIKKHHEGIGTPERPFFQFSDEAKKDFKDIVREVFKG